MALSLRHGSGESTASAEEMPVSLSPVDSPDVVGKTLKICHSIDDRCQPVRLRMCSGEPFGSRNMVIRGVKFAN